MAVNFKVPHEKLKKIAIKVAAALIVLAAVLTSVFIVDQTEDSVITRFGKYQDTVGPGLHFKLPFGIDRHYNVPTKIVQTEQFGFRTAGNRTANASNSATMARESTMLTGDLNIVDVEWIIQYRINDPRSWLFNVQSDVRVSTIRDVSQAVINELVGDRGILDVMGPERTAIETSAVELTNAQLQTFGLGVSIINVQLQNIVPPPGVQAAFEDVNKAIQDMNRLINEGKEAYNSEIPKASGEAEQLVQVARGYATERVNKALGDTARFNAVYEEYRRAPDVTRNRLYIETWEELFKDEEGASLIDSNVDNFLPFRNLNQGAGR